MTYSRWVACYIPGTWYRYILVFFLFLLFKSVCYRGLNFREMGGCATKVIILIIPEGRMCRGKGQAAQCRDEAGRRGGGGLNVFLLKIIF